MHGKWTEKVKFSVTFQSTFCLVFSFCLFWFVCHQSARDEIKIKKQKLKTGQKVDWKVTEILLFLSIFRAFSVYFTSNVATPLLNRLEPNPKLSWTLSLDFANFSKFIVLLEPFAIVPRSQYDLFNQPWYQAISYVVVFYERFLSGQASRRGFLVSFRPF